MDWDQSVLSVFLPKLWSIFEQRVGHVWTWEFWLQSSTSFCFQSWGLELLDTFVTLIAGTRQILASSRSCIIEWWDLLLAFGVLFKLSPESLNAWKNTGVWLTAIEFEVNLRSWLSLDDFNQVIRMVLELERSLSVREKCSIWAVEYFILLFDFLFSQTSNERKNC